VVIIHESDPEGFERNNDCMKSELIALYNNTRQLIPVFCLWTEISLCSKERQCLELEKQLFIDSSNEILIIFIKRFLSNYSQPSVGCKGKDGKEFDSNIC